MKDPENFWAFQPIVKPSRPNTSNKDWPTNDLDTFILSKLEANQLTPSAKADKVDLIRRAT